MIELLNMDCMEYMRGLPDKAFDLAIVDPPYGINAPKMAATPCQRNAGSKRLNGGGGKLKDRALNISNCEWDNAIPDQAYFDELMRVCENVIIWGGNYFPLPPSRCILCWDKVQPWENFSQIELAWTSFDSPAQLFKFDNRTGDKIHPTQKPVQEYQVPKKLKIRSKLKKEERRLKHEEFRKKIFGDRIPDILNPKNRIKPPSNVSLQTNNNEFSKTDAFLQTYEWRKLRYEALKLHGRKCQCCGASPKTGAVLNVDHIKPRKLYPALALDINNLQVLCHDCNHGKGNWDQTDFRDGQSYAPDSPRENKGE